MLHILCFIFLRCRLFHNASFFGSCNIHILNTECVKILKKIPAPKGYTLTDGQCHTRSTLATLQEIFINRLGFRVKLLFEILSRIIIYKSDIITPKTPVHFWQSICSNIFTTPITNGG